jgi:hypothetical protein
MIDPHFEGRSGFATTVGGPTRGAPKMTGGPLTAAVLFLIIMAGLIVYGSAHL